jgi:uncharacterized protein
MADHPNVDRIRAGYAAFSTGDLAALNDLFAEDLLWHVAGRNQLAGEYRGRDTVYGLMGKVMEITGGTFHVDVDAILADDTHATALVTITASRAGHSGKAKSVQVFHLRDGKVTEFWETTNDQYAIDDLLG